MASAGREAAGDDGELRRLRAGVRDLRARSRVYPLISQARGMLQERYALPYGDSAFALMQRASRRFNVKMRDLAGTLVSTPRPDEPDAPWFPRRIRRPEPALGFTTAHRTGSGSRGAVLGAVLRRTLTVVGTDMGDVPMADRAAGGLRGEKHAGLPADFVGFFAFAGEDGTSCAPAARDVTRVTVPDVETDPVCTEPARRTVLEAGGAACHSVPLTTAAGVCVGMASAHAGHPPTDLAESRIKALDTMGTEAGRWLAWYRYTVVADALEHLHALGRAHRGSRIERRR
ncbi:ANTAR domain-containing protein [Streptomyces sp. NPDC085946]|uniref:ANTAR domain-containing protein n=1 Tax=Streptomyces sp. NPDC085946 TaxID=3365744 RepID=UPI0037D385B7